jgi:diacylglycerol kinase family enzyme
MVWAAVSSGVVIDAILGSVRLLLIVNSSASSVTARTKVVIRKALAADHEVRLAETNRRGHAARLAQGAAAAGEDVVVVLGGDGTLNEAANGLAGTDTALAVLPGGSTNVFARTIGMPNDAVEATAVLVDLLASPSIERVGLGTVNDRYFLFHVGLGFDASLVEQVEKRSSLKRWAGHPLFAWAGVAAWFRHYDHRRPRFAIRYPDGAAVEDAVFAVVANTNPYTFVGSRPFDIAPTATLDRPLSVVTVRDLRFVRILQLVAAALRSADQLAKVRGVQVWPDVERLTVVGHGAFPYQVDGDFIGDVERLDIRYVPDALRLVRPLG